MDLDWAGEEGTAAYPGFLNGHANWPLPEPDGKMITQALDRTQLDQTIEKRMKSKSKRTVPPAAQAMSHRRRPSRQAAHAHASPHDDAVAVHALSGHYCTIRALLEIDSWVLATLLPALAKAQMPPRQCSMHTTCCLL